MAKAKHETPDPLVRSPLPVEAESLGHTDDAPPPFAVPKVVDAAGPLPRVVPELARAVPGTTRWKVRVLNFGEGFNDHKYILTTAGDEAGAKACFAEASGLNRFVADLKKRSKPSDVDEPAFVCKPLAD